MADEEPNYFLSRKPKSSASQLEPILIEAMEVRRKMAELEEELVSSPNAFSVPAACGGLRESVESARRTQSSSGGGCRTALEQIQDTGCVVKDLEIGLLDFPARIDDQDVYLCWRLGEDRIRFYHRQDEGFTGRKPIDPRDTGYRNPIQ